MQELRDLHTYERRAAVQCRLTSEEEERSYRYLIDSVADDIAVPHVTRAAIDDIHRSLDV